jgi:hypothetical protein
MSLVMMVAGREVDERQRTSMNASPLHKYARAQL